MSAPAKNPEEKEAKAKLGGWGWRAAYQWNLARPKMMEELQAKGILYRTLLQAQTRAEELGEQLLAQGVTDPFVREELVRDDLFLPEESRVPLLGEQEPAPEIGLT